MHYHIILTERCNLKCKYCYEKSMNEFENGLEEKWHYEEVPFDSEVEIEKLKKFIKPEDTLIFYGGEPLVMMDKMMKIMDNLNCRFMIQSNGMLLNKLPKEYLLKLDKMLLSIDGDRERTDHNRGLFKHKILINNIKKAREIGYTGEIVARMTLSFPDIFDQVHYLTGLIDAGIFDSVHWQIDAGFYKSDFNEEKFTKFVKEYNLQIDKLIEYWIKEMKNRRILKYYPFLGIFENLYYNKKSRLPCGSGYANYTINTEGKLSACPIMNSTKEFYCGSIEEGIKKEIDIEDDECKKCEYLDICGGRCLYWRGAKLWPKEGDKLICDTIKHLIDKIREKIPEIKEIIKSGKIKEEDFEFEHYFGPEIIP